MTLSPQSSVSDSTQKREPKPSELLLSTFGGNVPWYRTADGREVGKLPSWVNDPSVKASEMGPPIQPRPKLLLASRARRSA